SRPDPAAEAEGAAADRCERAPAGVRRGTHLAGEGRATEASHDGLAAGHGRSRAAADTRAGACTAGPPGCSGPHSSRRERSDAEEDTDPGHGRPDDEVGARR